mmetsp:Transcript_69932/g.202669  ORF Transcript_69932/g.202669 Transcript_69932/m.202669 type:complete len:100 (-) Transcript_69932:356-655(-)
MVSATHCRTTSWLVHCFMDNIHLRQQLGLFHEAASLAPASHSNCCRTVPQPMPNVLVDSTLVHVLRKPNVCSSCREVCASWEFFRFTCCDEWHQGASTP